MVSRPELTVTWDVKSCAASHFVAPGRYAANAPLLPILTSQKPSGVPTGSGGTSLLQQPTSECGTDDDRVGCARPCMAPVTATTAITSTALMNVNRTVTSESVNESRSDKWHLQLLLSAGGASRDLSSLAP